MLKEISLVWSMLHALVIFILLFEPRYSKKKSGFLVGLTMTPLIIANLFIAASLSAEQMGMALLVTLSLPSLVVFWILAKNRDGRFFFTFCLVDTIVLEIIYITQILNHYISPESDLFMFLVRLLAFPLLEWLIFKKVRTEFLEVQRHTKEGWGIFAIIGALFYFLMSLVINYPTSVLTREEYLPAAALLLVLIPIIYVHIILTLRRQQTLHEIREQDHILRLQVDNLTARMEEFSSADEKFRMERHDFRHKLNTLASLIQAGRHSECLPLLEEYGEALGKTGLTRYSSHAVLDAVLSNYIQKAQHKGIAVNLGLAFPEVLPTNEAELATAMANALENAIHACEKVEPEKRYIDIKVLCRPGFIIQIANSYTGDVEFDQNEIPISREQDHGFGTRSIAAFCQKNGGFYQFQADGERFTLYMNF